MLEILLGVAVGMLVCAFGMWCFIHGQQNALQIHSDKLPEQIKTPTHPISNVIESIVENVKDSNAKPSFEEQIENMKCFDGGLFPSEKGVD